MNEKKGSPTCVAAAQASARAQQQRTGMSVNVHWVGRGAGAAVWAHNLDELRRERHVRQCTC
jgi:hypothetical protein